MTRQIIIDCSKWKKVIGITLWAGATIGLGIGFYEMINYIFVHGWDGCNTIPERWCDHNFIIIVSIGFLSALIANFFNTLCIWLAINDHWKFFEVKCKDDEVREIK